MEISQCRYAGSHHSLFSSPDPNVEVENYACILKTGDIKFFIMTNMKGPLQVPSSVVVSNYFAENF